jgi:hypothetical protein
MSEIIRFAWGSGTLGDYVVGMSDKCIVAMEFGSHRGVIMDALYARFPESDVVDGQADLVGVVERVGQ